MAFFKKITTGKVVLMGRNTYESLPPRYRPLPNRINIVLTSRPIESESDSLYSVHSIEAALEICHRLGYKELYIIGGGQVYQKYMDIVDTIYATEVDVNIDGDTYFPFITKNEWTTNVLSTHSKDENNEYAFQIVAYIRKQNL